MAVFMALQVFIFYAMVAITFAAGCLVANPQYKGEDQARGYRQARQAPYGPPPPAPYKLYPEAKHSP